MSSLFSALASQATNQNPNQNQDQNNNNSNNGRQPAARGGGFSIANSALRSAGLMDDSGDTGMRTAGPSRTGSGSSRGGGRVARRGGSRNGEGSSRMSVDDTSFSSSSSRGGRGGSSSSARDRSNPLAQSGRSRRGGSNASRSGADSGIRGAADRRGRVPGGGELIGSSSASVIAAAQNGNSNASGSGSSSNPAGGKLIEGLKRFLASRWNEAAQFLNLENMSQDPILREMGFKPPGVSGSSKDSGSAIFKLCSEIYPNITTISLARNNLVNLGPVSTIPVFLPSLKNISLEGNELKWVKDLNSWLPSSGKSSSKSSKKAGRSTFKGLSELVLTGNPVKETFTATGNEESYRSDVLRKFPTLTLLDGVPVTTAESDFAKLPSNERKSNGSSASGGGSLQGPPRNFGIGMRPGFKEPTAEDITNGFLSKYFTLFDSDRDSLGAAYAENSTFTFAVNGHSSPRARSAGYYKSMPNQLKLDWSAYNTQDPRNVMRGGSRKVTGVRQGPNAITTALKHFPRTIHPVNDPSKFVVDSWILPNDNAIGSTVAASDPKPEAILFINVHGEFLEKPSEGIRSFDRAFIVAPAPPGSTASNAGWPCLILNDQLTFRHYAGSNAWIDNALPTDAQPGTYVAQPPASTSTATSSSAPAPAPTPLADLPPHLQNQPPQAGINEQQHLLSLQLAAQTGLTYPFAVQCMEGNSWDPAQAMANFQALKTSNAIPPEAFAVPQL